jgi:hypothetical protein
LNPGGGPRQSIDAPDNIDDIIRREWALLDGKKRGAVNQLADRLELPRWWVTKRATKLGLVLPHKKEPPWTNAELALLPKVPLHSPEVCARVFREHGFRRSPTAIVVKATRMQLSRRFHEALSAHEVAVILGIDSKTAACLCVSGELNAQRRKDRRLPQQWRFPVAHHTCGPAALRPR